VGAAGGEVVGAGPEVGDRGDLAVGGEIEEAQAGLGAFGVRVIRSPLT
jgi:hypothetical protein